MKQRPLSLGLMLLVVVAVLLLVVAFTRYRQPNEEANVLSQPDAVLLEVLPPSPDSYPGLRAYSRTATFFVAAKRNPTPPDTFRQTIGFDVRWEAIIHYDRHEGMLRVEDTGHTSLSMSRPSSHTTVLLPGTNDHTYRTYPDDAKCYEVEWGFKPSRFEESYGAVDIVNSFRDVYYLMDEENRMALVPLGPATVNGIATERYRLDPGPAQARLKRQYPEFEGLVSGEVALAAGTHALVRADFRIEGPSLPTVALPFTSGMMEGRIEMTHEIATLNSAPAIALQPECASAARP